MTRILPRSRAPRPCGAASLLAALALLTCAARGRAAGAAYFVSTSGNDSASGNAGAPWRTIQHAADTAGPGDTVVIRGGVYNEVVTITRSGSGSAGPIAFGSAPGETAVVDGTGLEIPNGQAGLITVRDASFIT